MRNMLTIIPRFLRDPMAFFESVQRGEEIRSKVISLAVCSVLFLMVYGFATGLGHSFLQALSSAVKMPLLFVATMAFCLPALYFFSLALLRTQLRMLQVTAVVLAGIGVTAFLLLGLAPVTFFFVLTSENYPFFQLLAVAFVAISGCIGLYFLWRGMTLVDLGGEFAPGIFGRALLGVWIILYAFVGSQMTWRLSPLIGDPEIPFVVLRPSRDNFYIDVIHAFERAMGISRPPSEGGGDVLIMLVLSGFCLSVLCVVALGIGAYVVQRIVRAKRSRPPRAAAGRSDAQQDALDDVALKAKYAPNSGSA
ncbi:MAG: actin-binding WH2 domain-containing protein [Anaerolineae bacterium]|nr:actin-binding WH2 domain-containing protein [Anaerolineae bacterium]